MLIVRPTRRLLLLSSSIHHNVAALRHTRTLSSTRQTSHSAEPPTTQPTVISEDGTRTLRQRQHGGKSLPLPPFLDPILVEAKSRHTRPKPEKLEGRQTAFQKALAKNAYALALASPVRQCALTTARLPEHFLLPLAARIDESTISHEAGGARNQIAAYLAPDLASTRLKIPNDLCAPSRSYILAMQHVVRKISVKRRWGFLVTERMKKWYALTSGRAISHRFTAKEWVFYEFEEKVLETLRTDVVAKLRWARMHKLVAPVQRTEDREGPLVGEAKACLLRVGVEQEAAAGASKHNTVVYDLPHLLGEAHLRTALESVGKDGPEDSSASLVVVQSRRTAALQLALLRLEAYSQAPPSSAVAAPRQKGIPYLRSARTRLV